MITIAARGGACPKLRSTALIARPGPETPSTRSWSGVLNALRQLSSRQRELVVLRFYLDLSVADTAQMLGCSQGTVKSYTACAITRLRTLLTDDSSTISSTRRGTTHDE